MVRLRAAECLGFLGVAVDPDRNGNASGDAEITGPGATAHTVVITAREDLQIVREVRGLLDRQASEGR